MLPLIVPTVLLGIGLYLTATLVGFRNGFVLICLGHSRPRLLRAGWHGTDGRRRAARGRLAGRR